MAVNLCLDFGNTNCKAAIFEENVFVDRFIFSEDKIMEALEDIVSNFKPQRAILSSVINHPEAVEKWLQQEVGKLVIFNNNTPLPIVNAYSSPESLGMDRLALAVAAQHYFPGKNALIISVGTAITYNFITHNRFFRGGAISPGIAIRFKALNTFTDKLPLVNEKGSFQVLGYDTESSIRSGVINGIIGEINYFIEQFQSLNQDFVAILTGGDYSFFENKIKNQIFADPQFLFKGLNLILKYNAH